MAEKDKKVDAVKVKAVEKPRSIIADLESLSAVDPFGTLENVILALKEVKHKVRDQRQHIPEEILGRLETLLGDL